MRGRSAQRRKLHAAKWMTVKSTFQLASRRNVHSMHHTWFVPNPSIVPTLWCALLRVQWISVGDPYTHPMFQKSAGHYSRARHLPNARKRITGKVRIGLCQPLYMSHIAPSVHSVGGSSLPACQNSTCLVLCLAGNRQM